MFGLIENNKMSVFFSDLLKRILQKKYNKNIDAFINIRHFDFFINEKTKTTFDGTILIDETFLKKEFHISGIELFAFGLFGNWSKIKKYVSEKINSMIKCKFGVESIIYISELNKSSKKGYVSISIVANMTLENVGFIQILNSFFTNAFVIREITSNDISLSIDGDKFAFNIKSDINIDLL